MSTQNPPKNPFADWDRMNTILFRYWTNYEEKGKTLKSIEAINKHNEKFRREAQFLIRRSCDPDFHIFLNKRLNYTKGDGRKSGLVIRKHMKELTKFILLDKLMRDHGRFMTISNPKILHSKNKEILEENEKTTAEENLDYQSYGHLLRMVNHYYPELITTRTELQKRTGRRKWSNGRRLENHRERVVETQFSKEENLPPGIFDLIVARAMRQDATEDFFRRMHMQNEEMINSMICDPIDLAKLLAFREDVLQIISEIGKNPFIDNSGNAEKQNLTSPVLNFLIQMLFQQVRLLVELRWFREKSPSIQHKIIFKEPRMTKFHKKDAAKAVNLNWLWFKDPEKVIKSMVIAGLSYIRFRREPQPQVGLWLIQECLRQLTLSEDEKALAYYNIAMMYQQTNQFRLMMRWLGKAMQLWREVGGHPGDEADIYAYMAEYWRLKDTEKYLSYRNKAEELLKNDTTLTQRRKAFHYKFLADCAAMFKDRAWEEHLYEQGWLVSSKDDSLKNFADWFKQCLDDLEKLGERGPQGGLGRFAAPNDWGETIVSSSFKTWSYGPESGN
jgi:hypothetical protein